MHARLENALAFDNLPLDMQRVILQIIIKEFSLQDQAKISQVNKKFRESINHPGNLFYIKHEEYKNKITSDKKFITEIGKLVERYDLEKGVFRRCLGDSFYMQNLKEIYDKIKNKEKLHSTDLQWFYKECYSPNGRHSHPKLYSESSTSLSATIYQEIKKLLIGYFPVTSDIGKEMNENFTYGLYYQSS